MKRKKRNPELTCITTSMISNLLLVRFRRLFPFSFLCSRSKSQLTDDLFLSYFLSDGELEAQWLVAAGFSQLTKAFQEVRSTPILMD